MAEANSAVLDPLQIKTLSEFTGLIKDFFAELNIEPEFHRYDQDVASPLAAYAPPRGGLWLARPRAGGPAIGLAGVRPLANRTCELKRFYVRQEERRKGFGKILLKKVMEFAQQAGYFEILLSVRPDWKAALTMCQRNGFTPCARYHPDRRAGIFYSYKFNTEVK